MSDTTLTIIIIVLMIPCLMLLKKILNNHDQYMTDLDKNDEIKVDKNSFKKNDNKERSD